MGAQNVDQYIGYSPKGPGCSGIHYNPSAREAEAGGLGVYGHSWLHSEFSANLRYMKSCLKKRKKRISFIQYCWILLGTEEIWKRRECE